MLWLVTPRVLVVVLDDGQAWAALLMIMIWRTALPKLMSRPCLASLTIMQRMMN
jgi:hypothetical protein